MSSQTRLFVGNLPENTNESDLLNAFTPFGEVRNLDVKCKAAEESNKKNFAFVTLSGSNYEIESCIKHFSAQDFNGNKLYVTRARESFLERLQRERAQEHSKQTEKKHNHLPKKDPVIKLGDKLTPRKRKLDHSLQHDDDNKTKSKSTTKYVVHETSLGDGPNNMPESSKKKDSDNKRMESMKKKRQEFKQKQQIIKTGLIAIDKLQNKKTRFSDIEEEHTSPHKKNVNPNHNNNKKTTLFDDADGSGDEVNFDIKKQFEGKKGQKVLDLQSRYKSDKRFVLDERFIEDDHSESENNEKQVVEDENIDLEQADEKAKQLNILQDVLGVSIRTSRDNRANNTKTKSKMGMLRFDPSQPEHARFLAPVEENQETMKKTKKKRNKEKHDEEVNLEVPVQEIPKVEVSKEQFYKVSETLKEAIAQPTTFSLRSLFPDNEEDYKTKDQTKQNVDYIPLKAPKERKVRNPLEPGEKNPFVYDSSESEDEADDNRGIHKVALPEGTEGKAVWRENLFFTKSDNRFIEGLAFFNKANADVRHKERRELKSLMKKRIYNRERKNQMFQKKIGGRKKSMKKNFRMKS